MNSRLFKIVFSIYLALCLNVGFGQPPSYKDAEFTEYFRRTSGWTASDGVISVPLPSGKTIWLMGDSYIDNFNPGDTTIPCLFQVRNSMLVQNILEPSEFVTILDNAQTGVNRTPVKVAANDNTYFWPGHGYAKGDTAIVFWQRYSGANFTHQANFVAKIYTPDFADASSIKELKQLPIPAELEFGTSVVVDSAQNFIYLYGFKKDWIIFRPLIARYPINQDVFGDWEFFNGSAWVDDATTSAQIMATTNDYVSPSFSVIKLQGKYYMISQDIGFLTCGLGRAIYSWESNNPEGPFTNKKLLYTIEDKYRGEYMITYNATAHPEFIRNNELLISYNVNGACTKYCEDPFANRYNADLYRPKFIRVPLDYIDPNLNVPDPIFPIDPPITGVPNENMFGDMEIYPNPSTNGEFTIYVERFNAQTQLKVTVTNVYGQKIVEREVKEVRETIKLSEPGVYFVDFSSSVQRRVTKVIVQK
jgi:hypothetical protein